jgi:putative oligomerization/nucleic acid binding protein
VRNPARASWLLFFAFLIGSLVLLRFVRSPWLAVVLLVAFVGIRLLLAVAATRWTREPAPRPTKNVTPVEPALPEGRLIAPDRPGPEVVVVDPEPPLDELEAKLAVLERLRANGLVTEAEYEAKRSSLIAGF